jgi:uncharacterized membrane protein
MSFRMRAASLHVLGVIGLMSSLGCGGSDDATDTRAAGPTWCEALRVIEAKCQRCHSDPPVNGAPYPFVVYEDTQRKTSQGTPIWERMELAVASGSMPYMYSTLDPPVEDLTAVEEQTLLDWFDAGAKPTGGTSCP